MPRTEAAPRYPLGFRMLLIIGGSALLWAMILFAVARLIWTPTGSQLQRCASLHAEAAYLATTPKTACVRAVRAG